VGTVPRRLLEYYCASVIPTLFYGLVRTLVTIVILVTINIMAITFFCAALAGHGQKWVICYSWVVILGLPFVMSGLGGLGKEKKKNLLFFLSFSIVAIMGNQIWL